MTYMMSMIPQCMGRVEVFFPFDYFYGGGYSVANEVCKFDNLLIYVPCIFMQILRGLIWSNLIDIYFIIKIHFVLKSQRDLVQNLITPKALLERKR